jgi:thiol-disulfide isomerase/thioredoxin
MKYLLLCVAILIAGSFHARSQQRSMDANTVLQKVASTLDGLSAIHYQYHMEIKYYEDNYHFVRDADLYIEFVKNNPVGLRMQANEQTRAFVFNGVATFSVDKERMTIDTAAVTTPRGMENNSYLNHSILMLRNVLPLVVANDSIRKSIRDTLIGKQHFLCIMIEMPGMYFDLSGSTKRIGLAGLRRPYYLIVDEKTWLPYQFIAKYIRGNDDRDFVSVIYNHINTKPTPPTAESWTYAAYANQYKPFKPVEKKPLVKTGTTMHDFTLPNYSASTIDSVSLHQYRNKVVLLDFWFKSCGPCMAAMPHYNALQQKFGKEGFQLLTINIEDGVDDIKFFFNKYKPSYNMLFNGGELFDSLGLSGCPSAILLDRSGKIVDVSFGFNAENIEKKISELLH